jgi:hypothetical protein
MRRFILAGVLLAAVGVLSAPGVASAQSTLPPRTETEPNNSIAQPDPVPVLTDTAIRGSIAPAGDRDFFRVVVSQRASVRFQTWVPDRPRCFFPPPATADTLIRLFDATGQQIDLDDDSGEAPTCSLLVRTLSPGTYFISVEEFANFRVIPAYTLEIDFTPDQVPCPANDDEDGDGLIDSRERLLSTLLGNPDSDRDGIVDGNDDANGNGEDDEDEDDGDDCPDEDSDGDGVDDEDEDDEDD